MTQETNVLVVDDEEDIVEILSYNLKKEGYNVERSNNGEHALEVIETFRPDLILLDIMMPVMDGVEFCKEIRKRDDFKNVLIAFLTARKEDYTQIAALDVGGDDFIQKPIKPSVLLSRVRALLRRKRNESGGNGDVITLGNIILDKAQYQLTIDGTPIELARKEFDLLSLLMSKPGTVFRRREIMSAVWGTTVIVGSRTIDVHIRKLREKMGNDIINTVK